MTQTKVDTNMPQFTWAWLALLVAMNGGCGDGEDFPGHADTAGAGSSSAGAAGEEQVSGGGGSTDAGAAGEAETAGVAGSRELGCGASTYDHDGDPDTACQSWTKCEPGQEVNEPGTAKSDQTCSECPQGTFTPRQDASSCWEWTSCRPGTFMVFPGTPESDRECAMCPEGTFTSTENLTECAPHRRCPTGTLLMVPGTAVSDQACADCPDGTMSTVENATSCAEWTICPPGTYVEQSGTSRSDRACASCADGTYSSTDNASSCQEWTTCEPDEYDGAPGTLGSNRICLSPPIVWQFGTDLADEALAIAIDEAGNMYVAGTTFGALDGTNAGRADAFVRKYGPGRDAQWTRQFGLGENDRALDIAVDSEGSIYVVGFYGYGTGDLAVDGYRRKYDAAGNLLWSRWSGEGKARDSIHAVAIDVNGDHYVAGVTYGSFDGQTNAGEKDAYVRKAHSNGNNAWLRQYGTIGDDTAADIAVSVNRNSYVVGEVRGELDGDGRTDDVTAYIRKYDSSGNVLWTRRFGATWTSANQVLVDSEEGSYVFGFAGPNWDPEDMVLGEGDGYVRHYDGMGTVLWTRLLDMTSMSGAAMDVSGNIYLAWNEVTTLWSDGEPTANLGTPVMMKCDALGNPLWTRRFEREGGNSWFNGLSIDGRGHAFLAGTTDGSLVGAATSGETDAFVMILQ